MACTNNRPIAGNLFSTTVIAPRDLPTHLQHATYYGDYAKVSRIQELVRNTFNDSLLSLSLSLSLCSDLSSLPLKSISSHNVHTFRAVRVFLANQTPHSDRNRTTTLRLHVPKPKPISCWGRHACHFLGLVERSLGFDLVCFIGMHLKIKVKRTYSSRKLSKRRLEEIENEEVKLYHHRL